MLSHEYIKGPIHIARCMGQLAVMYAQERYRAFVAMMDDATDIDFGNDEDGDAIHSDNSNNQAA
jgi:hypothetical protein